MAHHRQTPLKPPRLKGGFNIRIAQHVRVIVTAISEQPFGVDGQPPPICKVQHIAMVKIAMQNAELAGVIQKATCGFGGPREQAALRLCRRPKRLKPPLQRDQGIRRSRRARAVQTCADRAHDLAGLIVPPVPRHDGEGPWARRPLHQQPLAFPSQHLSRPYPAPPFHQGAPGDLLRRLSDLQHSCCAVIADRRQVTDHASERLTIQGKLPPVKPSLEGVEAKGSRHVVLPTFR